MNFLIKHSLDLVQLSVAFIMTSLGILIITLVLAMVLSFLFGKD